MNTYAGQRALSQYQQMSIETSLQEADSHAIIQRLMQAVLDCLSSAKGAIARNDAALKARRISHAVRILGGLRGHLDHEKGGEIAANLDALYDYMIRRLVEANVSANPAILDEVTSLMGEIKSAWDAIRPVARQAAS